jgi:mRNA-degrading endonuclease RelE of RelBE toxin-antitoxin system
LFNWKWQRSLQSGIRCVRAGRFALVSETEAGQILRKVPRLEHGLHGNIKRLQNADAGFRLRMGDYRVLFDVIGDRIVIQKVGNRKDVYD